MRNSFREGFVVVLLIIALMVGGVFPFPPTALAQSTNKVAPGMELCAKAAEIATRFGRLAALNIDFRAKIQTAVLDKMVGYVQNEILGKIGLDINALKQSAYDAAGNFVSNTFNGLIGNTMKTEVDKQMADIENILSEELKTIGRESALEDARDAAEEAVRSAADVAAGLTTVPTIDERAIARQEVTLKKLKEKLNKQIKEQKIAEVNADTRAKCAELLKTTNETIKKALLYQLSTQIVDWIQSGKAPQFIKQPGKFLEDTGRLAVDRFISRVAPRLCEPFRLNVQLQIPSVRREDNPFYEQITCTLDKVVANVENFYQDFRQGGWVAYNEMLQPQNNYYGASLSLIDEAARQQATAAENARLEQARGFVPVKQCTQWTKYIAEGMERGHTLTDYRISELEIGNFVYANDQTPDGAIGPVDSDGNVVGGFNKDPQTGPVGKGTRFWKNDYSYFWECENEKITSPATVAAGLAERASQVDLDNLAATQDVSMFLQTIEDSIVNKLVKSGVKGLQELLKGLPIPP
ncbi:MAG: hypothetical protein V1696_00280 [Candidatus Jorgensenbacteria bacterium]